MFCNHYSLGEGKIFYKRLPHLQMIFRRWQQTFATSRLFSFFRRWILRVYTNNFAQFLSISAN